MTKTHHSPNTAPFDLTDEQWQLVAPLIPPYDPEAYLRLPSPAHPRPAPGGRPTVPDRPVLDGILWKLRTGIPWYSLPHSYPSYQTCYRRYLAWVQAGVMDRILQALAGDLAERAGVDLFACLEPKTLRVLDRSALFGLLHRPGAQNFWQLSTLLLFTASRKGSD